MAMTAELIPTRDPRWDRALDGIAHDFYHLPGYSEICARQEGVEAMAFYAEDGVGRFLAPLLIRRIQPPPGMDAEWKDCTSPYGYSTPIVTTPLQPVSHYLEAFRDVARQHNVVSAFFRLHPLLPLDSHSLNKFGEIVTHGKTVYIDLTQSLEAMWRETTTNHKRNIRRLERLGFHVVLDDWSLYSDFITIYYRTMNRVSASKHYLFSAEYFAELRASLGSRLHLCCVLAPGGDVAAAGLFVLTNGLVEYHLGGSADAYLSMAPSKLMFDFMRRWAQAQSATVFHLGGGLSGHNDSLFAFKAGFSKARAAFSTFRMILDEEKNETLLRALGLNGRSAQADKARFFPAYRQVLS